MPGGERVESPFKDRLARLHRSIEVVWKESGVEDRALIEKIVEDAVIRPVADLTVRLLRSQRGAAYDAEHEGDDPEEDEVEHPSTPNDGGCECCDEGEVCGCNCHDPWGPS